MSSKLALPVIKPHPEFNFSDGSVIVTVEQTSFRIHQSILARHSDVFADMLTIPQPKDAEILNGCPTVELTGDSVDDFVDVMKAIYNPFHFDSLPPDADLNTLLTFISGILRISTKYNMPLLRKKCITIIQRKFPSTLSGCDEVLSSQYQYVPSAIVRAIPLALETNVPVILPWAYYLCTHIGLDALVNEPTLSWRDKTLCLAGKERLWEVQKTTTHNNLFEFTRSTLCTNACQSRLPAMTWRDTEGLRLSPHPLEEHSGWSALKLCNKCLAQIEAQHRTGREKVWEMLPGIFQLGSWEKIHNDQAC